MCLILAKLMRGPHILLGEGIHADALENQPGYQRVPPVTGELTDLSCNYLDRGGRWNMSLSLQPFHF